MPKSKSRDAAKPTLDGMQATIALLLEHEIWLVQSEFVAQGLRHCVNSRRQLKRHYSECEDGCDNSWDNVVAAYDEDY